MHAPEVLDAVEDLIGPDIRLFHLTVWPKDAGSGAYVSWHQDATYFALEPACHVTAWVALTDAPVEAGCMEVVPGSHKLGQLPHAEMQDPENLLSRGQTLAVDLDRTKTAFMPVKAGQFSLHHTHLVHNSRPNRSTTGASGSASATSRPRRAAPARRASPPCWCAARTDTDISTTSAGRRPRPAPRSAPSTKRPSPHSAG